MTGENKISTSQLFILLGLSRLFSMLAYAPQESLYVGTLTIITTVLSGVLQGTLLGIGVRLCRRNTGTTPLAVTNQKLFWIQSVCYWIFAMGAALFATVTFVDFMVTAVYHPPWGRVVAVTFVAAGGFVVCQGLEGLARGGAILLVMTAVGMAAVGLGLWNQYEILNFSFPILSIEKTALGSYGAFAMNSELFAMLLLLPDLKKPPTLRQQWQWVGGLTGASVALQLLTMLTLGSYGGRKAYPVFTAVTVSGFSAFQRLDSVFLALWVALGLVKLAVFFSLTVRLSAGAFYQKPGLRWVLGNGALLLVLVGLWTAREEWMYPLQWFFAVGIPTVSGVLVLPLVGALVGRKRREKPEV